MVLGLWCVRGGGKEMLEWVCMEWCVMAGV